VWDFDFLQIIRITLFSYAKHSYNLDGTKKEIKMKLITLIILSIMLIVTKRCVREKEKEKEKELILHILM